MSALSMAFVVAAVISFMPLTATAADNKSEAVRCTTIKCALCAPLCPNSLECKQACPSGDKQCGCECERRAELCLIQCGGEGKVTECPKRNSSRIF